ncbi:MAG: response regulator, partial [bacterium]|nr:response regulator [bacterium]
EHMAKIFDPYFTTKNMGPRKGMGLGLAICYSIVTKHEGAIKIESEPGKGTVVEVLLPAFRQAATPTAAAANEKKDTPLDQKPRIIVMDDDQNILEVTARMLEKRGCKVETFNEGTGVVNAYKEAANNPEKRPYAAVLLDIIIKKGMGGREALKKLLKFDPHAPVVAISGYMDEMDIAALKEEGFIEVLQKPYRSEDLQRALSKILPKVMN